MSITKEQWRDLCRQAANERDPQKLVKLNDEINLILQRASNPSAPSEGAEKLTGPDGRSV